MASTGKQSVLDNRIGWVKTYLVKAGLAFTSNASMKNFLKKLD
ncbi:winged helix-turn-helix domain-containing protein [Vibrio cholerae]